MLLEVPHNVRDRSKEVSMLGFWLFTALFFNICGASRTAIGVVIFFAILAWL